MKCELHLEIVDLHACPGDKVIKVITLPESVLDEIEVTETTLEFDEGLDRTSEVSKTRKAERKKRQPLVAFKKNDEEDITYRLGGPYGKIAGLFKDAAKSLYTQKVAGFRSSYKPLVKSLLIRPQRVTLKEVKDIEINEIPQITAGRSAALIILYHEIIPRCEVRLTIEMPEEVKNRFEAILKQAVGMPFGPKRRAEMKVLEQRWI